MNLFVDLIFFHIIELTHKTKFKRILADTVLIFHDAFLGIIGNETSVNYKDPTHHHFYHKIIPVLADTQVSVETFCKWQDEVIAGFNNNICWPLTLQKLVMFLKKSMSIVVVSLG